jgi:hypothetical protein
MASYSTQAAWISSQQRVVGLPATQVMGQQRAGRRLQLGPVGRARRPAGAIGSNPLVNHPELVRDAPYLGLPDPAGPYR